MQMKGNSLLVGSGKASSFCYFFVVLAFLLFILLSMSLHLFHFYFYKKTSGPTSQSYFAGLYFTHSEILI